MAQSTLIVRMDNALKHQFDTLCADFGMTTSTAINIFARAVVRERRIPFEISSPAPKVTRESSMKAFHNLRESAKQNGLQNMSMEEINNEINLARNECL